MSRAPIVLAALLLAGCSREPQAAVDDGGAGDGGENASATMGATAVTMRQCGQCHQSSNPLDGVLSGQDVPVPGSKAYGSNLTPDPDTGMDAWDAATIANSILAAQDEQGQALCPQMPAYADAGMSVEEALSIALYLQGLPAVWHPVPASECPPLKSDQGARDGR